MAQRMNFDRARVRDRIKRCGHLAARHAVPLFPKRRLRKIARSPEQQRQEIARSFLAWRALQGMSGGQG